MTQQRNETAIHRIDGYYIPRQNQSTEATFEFAKDEAITNMRRDIEDMKAITLETFLKFTDRK